jgi:hypothetical protein
VSFITGLIGKLDPRVLAAGITGSQSFLAEVMSKGNPEDTARIINAILGSEMDRNKLKDILNQPGIARTIAFAMNANPDNTSNMMTYLRPSTVAKILNDNQQFLTDLLSNLDPSVLVKVDEANAAFMKALYANMTDDNIKNLAKAMNYEFAGRVLDQFPTNSIIAALSSESGQRFMQILIANMPTDKPPSIQLDLVKKIVGALKDSPGAMNAIAEAINENSKFLADFMSTGNTSIITDLLNNDPTNEIKTFIWTLLDNLDGKILANAINRNPEMTGKMLASIDPKIVAGALNSHLELVEYLAANSGGISGGMRQGENHFGRYLGIRVNAAVKLTVWMPDNIIPPIEIWVNANEVGDDLPGNPFKGSSAEAWIWLGKYATSEKPPGW